jgi:hypothetical protein
MRNRVFHQARIADMMFEGVMTGSGPALSCQMNGSVALGVSGLRQFQPQAFGSRRPPPARLVGREIPRRGTHLVVLADGKGDPSDRIRHHYFFTSPAWDALRQWVMHHPRLAKMYASYDPYLPRWYERAIIEAGALSAWSQPLRPPGRGTAWP